MKLNKLTTCIFLAFFLLPLSACKRDSDASQDLVKQKASIEYPRSVAHSLERLSPHISAQSDGVVFYASYGMLTEWIADVKSWEVVSGDEMDAIFHDLGIHYQLNPASLPFYIKAGFKAEGGFAVGHYQGSPFALFEVHSEKDFRDFWDNFVNEEYGRPRYHEKEYAHGSAVQVNVLKKDACSLIFFDGLVLIVAGDAMSKGAPMSWDAAMAMLNSAKETPLSKFTAFEELSKYVAEKPMAAFLPSVDNVSLAKGSAPAKMVAQNISSAMLGMTVTNEKLSIDLWGKRKELSDEWLQVLAAKRKSADRLPHWLVDNPSTMLKLSVQTSKLETLVLKQFPASASTKWDGLKGKLNQRLLGLNFQTQILDNLTGDVFAQVYDIDREAMRGTTDWEAALEATALVAFLPFEDEELSNNFFAKVSALRKLIPPERIQIDKVDDILVAKIKVKGNLHAHFAYFNGVAAIYTERAWPIVKKFLKHEGETEIASKYHMFQQDDLSFALLLQMQDLVQYLSVKFEVISVQLAKFLAPLQTMESTLHVKPQHLHLNLQANFKNLESKD